MAHETKFSNGVEITSYLATAYAEGFCEGEGASGADQIRAWSYLCGTKVGFSLQGWFGRRIVELIDNEVLDKDGTVLIDFNDYEEEEG
jgi:hypothetical protein